MQQFDLFEGTQIGYLKVPIGGLIDLSDPTDLETSAKSLSVNGNVDRGFPIVNDAFLQGAAVIIANGDFLRVKDDGRQGKSDRNEIATEFQ